MTYFAVIRVHGPGWEPSRGMREQERWDEHAAFMDGLAEGGFIVLGGPLGDGSRVLHIVDAESEREVEERFAADPWVPMDMLRLESVERWEVLLGKSSQGA